MSMKSLAVYIRTKSMGASPLKHMVLSDVLRHQQLDNFIADLLNQMPDDHAASSGPEPVGQRADGLVFGPVHMSGLLQLNSKPFLSDKKEERFTNPSAPVVSAALQACSPAHRSKPKCLSCMPTLNVLCSQVDLIPISFSQPQAVASFAVLSWQVNNEARTCYRLALAAREQFAIGAAGPQTAAVYRKMTSQSEPGMASTRGSQRARNPSVDATASRSERRMERRHSHEGPLRPGWTHLDMERSAVQRWAAATTIQRLQRGHAIRISMQRWAERSTGTMKERLPQGDASLPEPEQRTLRWRSRWRAAFAAVVQTSVRRTSQGVAGALEGISLSQRYKAAFRRALELATDSDNLETVALARPKLSVLYQKELIMGEALNSPATVATWRVVEKFVHDREKCPERKKELARLSNWGRNR